MEKEQKEEQDYNSPKPPVELKSIPLDPLKSETLMRICNLQKYQEVKTLREQVSILYNESHNIATKMSNRKYALTQNIISLLLGIPLYSVKYHIKRTFAEDSKQIQANGRPLSLNASQIDELMKWIKSFEHPPKLCELTHYIFTHFGITLQHNTLIILLKKMGYMKIKAKPIEEERYKVSTEKLTIFYHELENFTETYDIPSFMMYNIDEEGHSEFADANS